MNWPLVFLGTVGCAYAGQMVFVYMARGRYGLALMMVGYIIALVGQYLDTQGV